MEADRLQMWRGYMAALALPPRRLSTDVDSKCRVLLRLMCMRLRGLYGLVRGLVSPDAPG
jgi:hypothetical protein